MPPGRLQRAQPSRSRQLSAAASSDPLIQQEDVVSAAVDWRFAPKWDVYLGLMFTQVNGGLAFGFLQRNNVDSTVGLRFRF